MLILTLCTAQPWCGKANIAASRHSLIVAFVYNFLMFVEWPDTPPYNAGPLIVASYKENPYEALFQSLTTREVEGRAITLAIVEDLKSDPLPHILFVPASEAENMPALFKELANRPTLTIGETSDFTRKGGMIRFYEESENLRVEINQRLTDQAKLTIRSRLLRLATLVKHSPPR